MKTKLTILLTLLCAPSLWSQEVPRAEIFGGYSYLNADTNNLASPSRQSANGWEASVSGNFNERFAVEGDFSGYYKTYGIDLSAFGLSTVNVDVHDFSFSGGPRVNFRPAFFHALIGGDRLTGSALGFSRSQNSFAAAFGGGVEVKVARQWAVRASADYVLTRHNVFELPGTSFTQNNFRASAGVVFYIFGGTGESAPPSSQSRTKRVVEPCEPVSEAPILGVSGCATGNGLRVTKIQAGSPGAHAGITPGDIVVKIDGRPVESGRDIDLAIAASQTGTITVGYLVKGNWLTEQEIKVR
jgi:opacity protein-like surface antigen